MIDSHLMLFFVSYPPFFQINHEKIHGLLASLKNTIISYTYFTRPFFEHNSMAHTFHAISNLTSHSFGMFKCLLLSITILHFHLYWHCYFLYCFRTLLLYSKITFIWFKRQFWHFLLYCAIDMYQPKVVKMYEN